MATGTNGIATEGEAKSKLDYSGSVDINKGCTKERVLPMGAMGQYLEEYKPKQLVKYSDIVKGNPNNIIFDVNFKLTGYVNAHLFCTFNDQDSVITSATINNTYSDGDSETVEFRISDYDNDIELHLKQMSFTPSGPGKMVLESDGLNDIMEFKIDDDGNLEVMEE